MQHREEAALREPDERLDTFDLAVYDGEHLAVVGAEEDDVVDGAVDGRLALADVLDVEALARRLVHAAEPAEGNGSGFDNGVKGGGAVRVGVVERDDDGAVLERGRVAVDLEHRRDALAAAPKPDGHLTVVEDRRAEDLGRPAAARAPRFLEERFAHANRAQAGG